MLRSFRFIYLDRREFQFSSRHESSLLLVSDVLEKILIIVDSRKVSNFCVEF